jgi:ubiquinone/menaquinone biosynthesis C-methylase UbiE
MNNCNRSETQVKKYMYTSRYPLILLLALCTPLTGCSENSPVDKEGGPYSYTSANQEGIGKFYMGREITYVMGHEGARWLDRPNRKAEERTDLLIQNLPINPGDKVADIGAGTGYFSLPMAELAGDEGMVFAVDIQPEMLAIIEDRSTAQGITNITQVLATEKNPGLPANSINLALFVDMYHEFEWPQEVMSAVYESMVSGGKIVLVEYRAEDPKVKIKKLHKMTERQARLEMEAAGWVFIKNEDFLPRQHFMVFEKP